MAVGYISSRKHKLTSLEPLRFSADGKFKILHLTDIHKVHPDMDDDTDRSIPENKSANTLNTIETAIEKTKPDLVVFGGDNIGGHWDEMTDEYVLWCLNSIMDIIKKHKLPLAVVFGNHDGQNEHIASLLNKEIQMSLYMSYENFRGCFNEADIYGCGNYHLHVLANDSDEIKWNIWCLDSNDYPRDAKGNVIPDSGYDGVHADQVQWYEETVAEEKALYGRTIPAILFQHVPVNQELDFIEECGDRDEYDYERQGKYFRAKDGALKEGLLREKPCPADVDRSEFEAWVRQGDIKAAFFGHDHVNTFRLDLDGISLYQTVGCGYETYGKERGGRLITLCDDGSYTTELIIIEKKY